ncbi:MAG: hypothetical protein ACR2KJ_04285 [Jatrophihabitans sp.]
MTALSDVLWTANDRNGWSGRELARQARERGYSLNHDTAARYLRGDHGQPDERTLEAFSVVLGVPMARLRKAADLPSEVTEPYRPPPEAARLSRRQRKAVDELIRAMTETHRGRGTARYAKRAARLGEVEPDEPLNSP